MNKFSKILGPQVLHSQLLATSSATSNEEKKVRPSGIKGGSEMLTFQKQLEKESLQGVAEEGG